MFASDDSRTAVIFEQVVVKTLKRCSLKNSLLRCKNHSEAQCIMSSATVSLMGPATFLAVTKIIALDTNILCNDDARQVERKIAHAV